MATAEGAVPDERQGQGGSGDEKDVTNNVNEVWRNNRQRKTMHVHSLLRLAATLYHRRLACPHCSCNQANPSAPLSKNQMKKQAKLQR